MGSENRQTNTAATSATPGTPPTGHCERTNGTCRNQHSPGTPKTGLREHGNNTSKSNGRSGRQKAATRRNMRRDERVTVQGPAKKQPPDGLTVTRGVPGAYQGSSQVVSILRMGGTNPVFRFRLQFRPPPPPVPLGVMPPPPPPPRVPPCPMPRFPTLPLMPCAPSPAPHALRPGPRPGAQGHRGSVTEHRAQQHTGPLSPPPPLRRDALEEGEVPPPLQGAQPMPSHCLPDG